MADSCAKSRKIPSPDEIKEIIGEAMEYEEVKHRLVPYEDGKFSFETLYKSKRYFKKYSFAWFKCPNVDNNWPSARAWCIIDLKLRRICYRYWQKCKYCDAIAKPKFPRYSVENMAQHAVDSYLTCRGWNTWQESPGGTTRNVRGDHDEERCQECQMRGEPCTTRRRH